MMTEELQEKWDEIVRINHDVPAIQAVDAELTTLRADLAAAIAAKEVLYNKYISQNTELHLLKREWMKVNGKDVFEIVKERDDAIAAIRRKGK